ncbi:MAG: hypothetical protein JW892_02950, partial [Anaerolineae bacterium]|nr:hypothetical protein [Anaerolineae bacterium]
MRHKTPRSLLVLLVLAGMLLTPLAAVARLVGNEFSVVRYNFHEAWTGNIAYDASYNKFAIAWAEQSQLAYYAEPYVGWVVPGNTAVSSHRVAAMTTHSSSTPDISCEINARCLVTWVSNEQVFARIVRPDGTMDAIWRVDTGQPALRSVLTEGGMYYLIVWEMVDGRIAMRHVDRNTGPLDAVVYVQLPAGCTQGRNVQVTNKVGSFDYGIAYECSHMVHLEVRRARDLAYLWWRNPEMPNTAEYDPAITAYSDPDSGNAVLLAFQTADPDLGIFGQRYDDYGNALGPPFAIAPPGSREPRLVDNHITREVVAVYEQGEDIHLKRMSYDGAAVGIPYAITSAPGRQYAPRISDDLWREHLVVWTDLRAGLTEGDIYAQWIETEPVLGDGVPLDNELPDSGVSYYQAPAQMNQWLAIGIRPGPVGDLD